MTSDKPTTLDFAEDLDFSEILTNPILDIAARFWEEERYEAFRVCYRSMRVLDNLVDDRKASGQPITESERLHLSQMITGFLEQLESDSSPGGQVGELREVMKRFAIPVWPWQRLARAMVYDLSHLSFATFHDFLRYSEGAAIAPAAVFMHLCGISQVDAVVKPPPYDIRKAARPLALFSYLVHVVRDCQKDAQENLNYFADNLVASHNLDAKTLSQVAASGQPSPEFRGLIGDYHRFGEFYRNKARKMIDSLAGRLDDRYLLSVEMIYSLYLQIFERIHPRRGFFSGDILNPSPDEVQSRINQTVSAFKAAK
jgi:phytoene/squalene synthetase